MSRRTERIGELLRKELSSLLANEMSDPRLPLMVSITHVDVSADLRLARVFVSIMGSNEEKHFAVKLLRGAAGFLIWELRPRLSLRYIPELSFELDQSIEEGARLLNLMDNLHS